MQLTTLLLGLLTAAFAKVESNTPSCWAIPPEQHTPYCILTYWSNSGMIIDITKPVPIIAQAAVYSPDCTFWGETTTIVGNEVELMALGLSSKLPLKFNTEVVSGNDWASPKFTYGGLTYTLNTAANTAAGCDCWGADGNKQCHCAFL